MIAMPVALSARLKAAAFRGANVLSKYLGGAFPERQAAAHISNGHFPSAVSPRSHLGRVFRQVQSNQADRRDRGLDDVSDSREVAAVTAAHIDHDRLVPIRRLGSQVAARDGGDGLL